MNQPIKYPDVPLPGGKLYTDFEGWHKYIKLVNQAAGRGLAGFGAACPCNGKPMRFGYVALTCENCGSMVSIAVLCDVLGLPYERYANASAVESTVG